MKMTVMFTFKKNCTQRNELHHINPMQFLNHQDRLKGGFVIGDQKTLKCSFAAQCYNRALTFFH